MTSPPADGDSSVRAVRSLVDAFLAEDPMWQEWKGDAATILDVGDQEDHLVVAVRKGVVTFETISRGHRSLTAEFGRELDAWRFLIMQLGDSWRSARRMRDINPRELGQAPGTTLERGPSGSWLTWPGGAAIFHSDLDAIGFSWVARAEPADIAASYRHVNGEPLFDLGLPAEAQRPAPPAPRRVMPPPPVETPPPDDLDAADLAVVDAVAAELNWARRPATGVRSCRSEMTRSGGRSAASNPVRLRAHRRPRLAEDGVPLLHRGRGTAVLCSPTSAASSGHGSGCGPSGRSWPLPTARSSGAPRASW